MKSNARGWGIFGILLMIALGIGIVGAIYGIASAVMRTLFPPMPYPNAAYTAGVWVAAVIGLVVLGGFVRNYFGGKF